MGPAITPPANGLPPQALDIENPIPPVARRDWRGLVVAGSSAVGVIGVIFVVLEFFLAKP